MASSAPPRKATVAGVCSSSDSVKALLSMRLLSSNLAIRLGRPLPAVPTLTRSPLSSVSAVSVAWGLTRRAASSR